MRFGTFYEDEEAVVSEDDDGPIFGAKENKKKTVTKYILRDDDFK
jgi:hypothetical protein